MRLASGAIKTDLFDGQHHDWSDDGHSDGGEDSKGAGSDELVGVLQPFLEG